MTASAICGNWASNSRNTRLSIRKAVVAAAASMVADRGVRENTHLADERVLAELRHLDLSRGRIEQDARAPIEDHIRGIGGVSREKKRCPPAN